MKRKLSYLLCCFTIVFFGCDKYNAIVGGVVGYGIKNTPTMLGVCYSRTHNPTITDSVAKCNVGKGIYTTTIKNLELGVTYFARAFATKSSGETIYGSEVNFTTKAIQIDYWKFYGKLYPGNGDFNDSLIVVVESEKCMIYGHGFNNSVITLKMVAKDNKNDIFYPTVEIKNDSVLNFKIPDDLLGSNPYVSNKSYYLLVNNGLFRNYLSFFKSLNDKLYDGSKDTAFFRVDNKDIHIDQIKLWPVPIGNATCNTYDIHGEFGGYSFYDDDPNIRKYHGVYNCPLSQRLFVKVNGVLSSYPVANGLNKINTGRNCGDVIEMYVIRDDYMYYHDSVLIRIITNFPYNQQVTFQVENTMADGTVFKSNEYTFTNPQTTTPCNL